MKQLTVLFSKPLVLPTDEGDRIPTYGLYLDKTERATFHNISEYVQNYISVISQLYKDNVKRVNDWIYEKDGREIVIWGPVWNKYADKAKEAGMEFAIIDDGDLEIKEDERWLIFITQKELWEYLKSRKDIEWHG